MLKKISSSIAPKQVINALITLYHQGKIEDILSRAPKILEEYPNTPILYNILGSISAEKGLKLKAASYFRKTIELIPEDPDAYNNLGAVLNDLQENQEALISIKKAIALRPDYESLNNSNKYPETTKPLI